MTTTPLAGRSALVTGGSRGIGLAVARALVRAGARVALLARSRAVLDTVVAELGPLASAHTCDLTAPVQVDVVLPEALQALGGRADILIGNAGVFPLAPVAETSPGAFEETLQANLVAPFRMLHAVLPGMRTAGQGHIVTIGSVADRHIFPGNGAYSTSKFGARALHEVLRAELTGSGVRCTLVSPAATDTPIWDPIDPDHTPGFPKRADMLRAEDVADAVLWALTRPPHVNVDELRIARS